MIIKCTNLNAIEIPPKAFENSDYFKLKLSGDERQNISINYEDAYIEYLIVNNTSEEGINFVFQWGKDYWIRGF